ncbi:MAG: DUF4136 domain-containing protein [Nitrosospira sp.]
MKRITLFLLVIFMLGGCGTTVRSNVSTFHELPSNTQMSYAMRLSKAQERSLEYKTYANIIKRNLETKKFLEVPLEQAELVVLFSYGVGDGKETTTVENTKDKFLATSSIPDNGVGKNTGPSRKNDRMHYLKLEMVDAVQYKENGTIHQVYEARVTSPSRKVQLAAVFPYMAQSLFEDFPGKTGSVRKSTVIFKNE